MRELIKRWARGDAPSEIARDNDISEATLRVLASSDAFKAVAEDELRKLKTVGDTSE